MSAKPQAPLTTAYLTLAQLRELLNVTEHVNSENEDFTNGVTELQRARDYLETFGEATRQPPQNLNRFGFIRLSNTTHCKRMVDETRGAMFDPHYVCRTGHTQTVLEVVPHDPRTTPEGNEPAYRFGFDTLTGAVQAAESKAFRRAVLNTLKADDDNPAIGPDHATITMMGAVRLPVHQREPADS